jgi:hypothetical protein
MNKVTLVALIALTGLSGCNKTIDSTMGMLDSSMKSLDNAIASATASPKDPHPPRILSGAMYFEVKENGTGYYRFIDTEAGVVCYTGRTSFAPSCVPLSQTKLAKQ